MYGSAIRGISIADCTRVGWPSRSSASCRASAFITVPSMPMWSDCVASMPAIAPLRPRQKLPPPTTTATSTSRPWRSSMMSRAVMSSVVPSMPVPPGPASASPDGLKTMRRQRGVTRSPSGTGDTEAMSSADLDLSEIDDRCRPDQLRDRLLVVLGVGLVEQRNGLEEPLQATFDDLRQRLLGLALVAGDRLERLALGRD